MVRSCRKNIKSGNESEPEVRLYITSMCGSVEEVANASRSHWGIENNLHWVLDVAYGEDQCLTRLNAEAVNLAQLRRLSVNLLKLDTDNKISANRKRFIASIDPSYLERLVINSKLFS
jgi:predicted transposase YbfD/YdcC